MATTRTISTLSGLAAAIVLLAAAAAPAAFDDGVCPSQLTQDEEGYAPTDAQRQEPDAIEAAFPAESHRPGAVAKLRLWTQVHGATVRIHRVDP